MSLTCEISGQPLSSDDEAVVTPSGHVCVKRLLLTKLSENGGIDPFVTSGERNLTEDQLITLSSVPKIMPPRPVATNMSSILSMLQKEYDALILELFDTRKTLEETRQELSNALYQNDAAIRVIARLIEERDQARSSIANTLGEPTHKKRKLEENGSDEPLLNDIPETDLQNMVDTWQTLHSTRKQVLKDAPCPSKDDLAAYKGLETKSWHKTTCKGLTALAQHGTLLLTAGKDKQMIAYDTNSKVAKHTMAIKAFATCVDFNEKYYCAGLASGQVLVYDATSGTEVGSIAANHTPVVDVRLHPDQQHILIASESGRLTISRGTKIVSVFKSEHEAKYVCGALHPDGLIYTAGNQFGEILVWDLKSKTLASTLKEQDNSPITHLDVSPNGYHIAASDAAGKVRVWDLRKQQQVALLNEEEERLETVEAVRFDPSGKYLAYGGTGGSRIVAAKTWENVTNLQAQLTSGLAWGDGWIAKFSTKKREVAFYGREES